MNLVLSSAEQARFVSLSRVLLSPHDFTAIREWAIQVCRETKALLHSDITAVTCPVRERLLLSEEVVPAAGDEWAHYINPVDRQFGICNRVAELGAYTRDLIWQPFPREALYNTAYYADYIVPNRFFDGAGLAIWLGGSEGARNVGALQLFHEHESGPRFDERTLALLRLLYPAFAAGMRTAITWRETSDVSSGIDEVEEGMLICDRQGRPLHANAALLRLLENDQEAGRIRGEMDAVVRGLKELMSSNLVAVPAAPVVRRCRTSKSSYRIRGAFAAEGKLGPGLSLIITVELATLAPSSVDELRKQFGLTRAQANVALLIARGKSDQEIADMLGVSRHTARNHAAQVRQKLGVNSRGKIAVRIRTHR
jgi:DNA-binding CsgD family transcriptional regulator/PAS domain-containing protein